jgi:hypothetical protein
MSPSQRERIRAQVRESRSRQGLPDHVQDAMVLDRLAGRLLEQRAAPAGPSGSASGASSSSASPNSKGPGLTNRSLRHNTPRTTEEVRRA